MIGIHSARRETIEPVLRQLASGARASRRRVGYLGSEAALTTLSTGDALPSAWSAHWDGTALVINASDVTVDHYRINGSLFFQNENPTVTNCVVRCQSEDIFGITLNAANKGILTVTDTTVLGDTSSGTPQVNGISSSSGLVTRRCDVSLTGDGIHMVAQPDEADAIISQCYIHDLGYIDESQHCDAIQIYNHDSDLGFFTVEHCYIQRSLSTIGTPINAAMTCGYSTVGSTVPLATAIIDNNYFESGAYHLRMGYRLHNCVVTNNDFGPIYTSEFGLTYAESPVTTWTNNLNSSGATISNPFALTAPTIREVLQTSNDLTTSQTLSTGSSTASGDMLVIIYATDNDAITSAPTSTAGTLTQYGSTIVDGNSKGVMNVYTVPVASAGSKDVVMPAAGGYDIFGMVMVMNSHVETEGFAKTSYASYATSFTTPSTTFAGSLDMFVSISMNLQGKTFDLSTSGLTQRAAPTALPFSAVTLGTANLSSSGTTPTYTFTSSDICKPGLGVFGLQKIS